MSSRELKKYVGTYKKQKSEFGLKVSVVDHHLMIINFRKNSYHVYPYKEKCFFSKNQNFQLEFKNINNSLEQLIFVQGDAKIVFIKV